MDPAVIEMLSKVEGSTKTPKKGAVEFQELFGQLQEDMNQRLSMQNQSQFKSEANQQILGDRFNDLMSVDASNTSNPIAPDSVRNGPSIISEVLRDSDRLLQTSLNKIQTFSVSATGGELSLKELSVQLGDTLGALSDTALNMGVHISAEKSSKQSVETLIKN